MASRKWIVAALVPVAIFTVGSYFRPDRALRVATGVVAHNVCAKSFVSGLDPETVFSETMERDGIRRLRRVLDYHLDRSGKTVDASVGGLFASRALFRDGLGCVLQHGAKEPYLLKSDIEALKTPKSPPLLAEIAGPDLVQPSNTALKDALDHAFEEPAEPPFRRTKAVVVVRDGKVIAERYAPGIGVDTPLLGFSMTKSVVNALLGIMTQQGLVSPSIPAPVPEWRNATDPRREIEVEHLMRMTTGLALDETNSGFDPSSQMIYLEDDMAGFAVNAPVIAPPGKRWAYSSATTQLLARIIRDAAGGPEQTLAFAWRELFNPLGMRSVTLRIRRRRHAAGLDLHAGERTGLGALRPALSQRRRGRRQAHPARGLGGFFRGRHARHRLWRGLLDQSQRARARQGPRARGNAARCILCVRRSRPAHRDPADRSTWSWFAWAMPSRPMAISAA